MWMSEMKGKEREGNDRQVEKKHKLESKEFYFKERSPSVNVSTYKEGYTLGAHEIMKQH